MAPLRDVPRNAPLALALFAVPLCMLAACDPLAPGEASAFPADVDDLEAANTVLGDPHHGRFAFADAVAGLPPRGVLRATLQTDEGDIECVLDPGHAPIAVANFVGLARGRRPFRQNNSQWGTAAYYDGIPWHRALEGQFVQTGRRGKLADGGYLLQDEVSLGDSFNRSGVMAMAGIGDPHSASTQFFVTTGPAEHLKGQHTIFGQCDGEAVLRRLEGRVMAGETPKLVHIEITRG